jgi:glutaredoxin-related protein
LRYDSVMSSLADRLRARAHAAIDKLPGKLGDVAKKANEALGRPLADEHELADRRAFDSRSAVQADAKPASAPAATGEAAPVIVYYMEKQKRDVSKLTDVLDTQGIQYTVTNIQEDPAAQFAVRRDSKGIRLPVCFIAGECVGGRVELVNLASSGELKKKVFGA